MSTKTKLPERWRRARNIDEGYELRRDCPDHGDEWVRVVSALHVLGPIKIVSLKLRRVEGASECLGNGRVGLLPDEQVYSRRPAEVSDDVR